MTRGEVWCEKDSGRGVHRHMHSTLDKKTHRGACLEALAPPEHHPQVGEGQRQIGVAGGRQSLVLVLVRVASVAM